MEYNKTIIDERLELFGIAENDPSQAEIREMLSRLLAAGSISFGELLTARDIVQENKWDPPTYVFLAAMYVSQHAGNTFMRLDEIEKLLIDGSYLDKETATQMGYPTDVPTFSPGFIQSVKGIGNALTGELIVYDKGGYYFHNNHVAVTDINTGIAERITQSTPAHTIPMGNIENYTTYNGFSLNAEQTNAVQKAISSPFLIITGGPGTGKTTIVCSILRMLFDKKILETTDEVALAAPTGRAAQRMGEALKKQYAAIPKDLEPKVKFDTLTGTTIHSLLGGYAPKYKHNKDNPLDKKVIIIDEVSMVDVALMRALLTALKPETRLILLGDKDQLPSVEAGAVLGDIVNDKSGKNEVFIAHLTETHRFNGDLKTAADIINSDKDRSDELMPFARHFDAQETARFNRENTPFVGIDGGCKFSHYIANNSLDEFHTQIRNWITYFGLNKGGKLVQMAEEFPKNDAAFTSQDMSKYAEKLFEMLDKSRILAVVRNGPYGVQGLNRFILGERFGKNFNVFRAMQEVGVPILITENNREKQLFNGDIGITVKNADNNIVAIFPRGDKVIVCPIVLLPAHDLAYAITIHKSQGSEFDNVLVVLPTDERNPLLNKALIYTGITRAKSCAIVYGTETAFDKGITTKVTRNTGISIDCAAEEKN